MHKISWSNRPSGLRPQATSLPHLTVPSVSPMIILPLGAFLRTSTVRGHPVSALTNLVPSHGGHTRASGCLAQDDCAQTGYKQSYRQAHARNDTSNCVWSKNMTPHPQLSISADPSLQRHGFFSRVQILVQVDNCTPTGTHTRCKVPLRYSRCGILDQR